MITIEKIADKYEDLYGEDAVAGLSTPLFQNLPFKEQFEVLEFAKGQNIDVEYDEDEIDGGKLILSGDKDPDFDFLSILKDIAKD